ncbi:MAG: hypothetical protein J7647_06735 [Cyanobacteria bacterium SBLK]|nr:hypothetical protein [Cyanobacteria bacterium SBLK]
MVSETFKNTDRDVYRDGNVITIRSLSTGLVVGNFIKVIYQGTQCGYQEFDLDFSNVESVYPNACVPFAGLLEYYQSNQKLSFTYKNIPDFLRLTNTLAPSVVRGNNIYQTSPLNIVWKFSSSDEVHSLVEAYLDTVSKSTVCQNGVIQGLEWCLNEIMDNVLQHSSADYGYVMGQIHQNSQHIAVCIYDYGQGILNTLRTSYAPNSAVDAITIAIKEGVTRDKSIGQGNGMWGLSNIVRSNSGLLNIISGSGFLAEMLKCTLEL